MDKTKRKGSSSVDLTFLGINPTPEERISELEKKLSDLENQFDRNRADTWKYIHDLSEEFEKLKEVIENRQRSSSGIFESNETEKAS